MARIITAIVAIIAAVGGVVIYRKHKTCTARY